MAISTISRARKRSCSTCFRIGHGTVRSHSVIAACCYLGKYTTTKVEDSASCHVNRPSTPRPLAHGDEGVMLRPFGSLLMLANLLSFRRTVGNLTYHWTDRERPGVFTAAPDDPRELMVQIWYRWYCCYRFVCSACSGRSMFEGGMTSSGRMPWPSSASTSRGASRRCWMVLLPQFPEVRFEGSWLWAGKTQGEG